ncbi:MAG: hypothetical protein IPJ04_16185 [Candidatus Eisenbacteria bacterium]|nr:hypothetical protein [Candidatus Eisenbacteria bacterium]
MSRLRSCVLALAFASLLAPAPAHASTHPGVAITVEGFTGPIRVGVPVTAQVRFTAHEAVTLKQFGFSLRGTAISSDAPADSAVLAAGQTRIVNVSFTPLAEDRFKVEVKANGVRLVRYRDWSQAHVDLMTYGAEVGFDPQPDPPIATPNLLVPGRADRPLDKVSPHGLPVQSLDEARRMAGALTSAANVSWRVHGSVHYTRPDGKKEAVDGAGYVLWLNTYGVDVPVAVGVFDAFGRFDHNVSAPAGLGHDFYLSFYSDNSWVHVLAAEGSDEPYKFTSKYMTAPAAGGDVYGDLLVPTGKAAPLHMMTTITRGFRFLLGHSNFTYPDDIDDLDVSYPDDDWPNYSWPLSETIFIPDYDAAWRGRTLLHEFGHHVNYELPISMSGSSYDDGNCEPAGSDGRHCQWCAEDDEEVAVPEGFAEFFESMAQANIKATYGTSVTLPDTVERLPEECNLGASPCGGCSPMQTEGFFTALLVDLADDTPGEQDPNATSTSTLALGAAATTEDQLHLGFSAVLNLMADYDVTVVSDFITAFFSRYGGSYSKTAIWKTFANAGYFLDVFNPTAPSNVHSTSHVANVSSPDGTIDFAWTAATDLNSAIQHYEVSVYRGASVMVMASATGTTFSTPALPAGTYRAEVRALDLQGNRSAYVASPNYIVRDPILTDLNERLIAGWTDGIVARCITGATSTNCTDTPTLAGNQDSTWIAWAAENTGEVAVATTFRTRFLLDGEPIDSVATSFFLTYPNSQTVINRGPYHIRGGRHTLEAWTDASEVIGESDETNNRWGRQFVWKPLPLARNANLTRQAPPHRFGGSNVITVPVGGMRFDNCDGFSYTHANSFPLIGSVRWIATEVWGEHPGGRGAGPNYDLTLHYPTGNSSSGFSDGFVTSSREAWLTDAVITNNVTTGLSLWNVGVVNASDDTSDFHVRVNTPLTLGVGDSLTVNFAANQMVVLYDLDVLNGETGRLTAEIRRLNASGNYRVSWLNSATTYRALASADGTGTTDASGFGTVSFDATLVAHYALLVWRDPAAGTGAATLSLKLWRKPSDLAIVTPSGWSAPIVPRPTNDATSVSAPLPSILYGDDKPTWLSVSQRNASDVATPSSVLQVRLDEQVVHTGNYRGLVGPATHVSPNIASPSLPGGRHVLSMLLDPSGAVPELDELNNTTGAQWTWIPDTVAADAQQWRRGQQGGPIAGWEFCDPAEYLYFDCDGTRVPAVANTGVKFAALVLAPRDSSDVDLTLHDPATSSDNGFENPLEGSYWGGGSTELLLLNYSLASRKAYDAGITRASDDTSSYVVDFVTGVTRNPASAYHGPFTLGAHRLAHVHQFSLPAGRHVFHLRNLAGTVDWALAAYDADRPFQNRSQGEERGWSWQNGAGADEEVTLVLGAPATFALVAYKSGSADVAKSGNYQIELYSSVAGTDDAPIADTRLSGAFPNPFHGEASIHFDVARRGPVTVEVFDLRGARVRTLASGEHAPGRYTVAWDGRDESGARTPAGVYLVRMMGPGYDGQRKLVRVE